MLILETVKKYVFYSSVILILILAFSVWMQKQKIDNLIYSNGQFSAQLDESVNKLVRIEKEKSELIAFHQRDLNMVVNSWMNDRNTRQQIKHIQQKAKVLYHEKPEVKAWGDTHIPDEYLKLLNSEGSLQNP